MVFLPAEKWGFSDNNRQRGGKTEERRSESRKSVWRWTKSWPHHRAKDVFTFAPAAVAPELKERTPDQTNCNPANNATVATTVFSFCAGTFAQASNPSPRRVFPPPAIAAAWER